MIMTLSFIVCVPSAKHDDSRDMLVYSHHSVPAMHIYYIDTPISVVEETFNNLTSRDDIGIILINQHVRTVYPFSFHMVMTIMIISSPLESPFLI